MKISLDSKNFNYDRLSEKQLICLLFLSACNFLLDKKEHFEKI